MGSEVIVPCLRTRDDAVARRLGTRRYGEIAHHRGPSARNGDERGEGGFPSERQEAAGQRYELMMPCSLGLVPGVTIVDAQVRIRRALAGFICTETTSRPGYAGAGAG